MPIVILAHGVLGNYDELIFVSVAIVFVAMMAISWFRSQQLLDDDPDTNESEVNSNSSDVERFELK